MAHVTCLKVLFFPVIISLIQFSKAENAVETDAFLRPTVVVAFLVRNKAHTLPWFLGHLEMLAYPKDRISLW